MSMVMNATWPGCPCKTATARSSCEPAGFGQGECVPVINEWLVSPLQATLRNRRPGICWR